MAYCRVIPRDLFNEANLLKCYGALWIALDNRNVGERVAMSEPDGRDAFDVIQDDDDGSTYLRNVRLAIGGRPVHLKRPLNSREAFPLYARWWDDDEAEDAAVFNDDGTLHADFLAMLEA